MKTYFSAGAALLATTTMAGAVGLDRSNQNVGVIFEETGPTGGYVELSYGSVNPSIDGTDVATVDSGNVGQDFSTASFGFKYQYTDQFSASFIYDQPYGADISYPAGSPVFGGTQAFVDSDSYSIIGRYEMGNGFSIHGGARVQTLSADVTLSGAGYGPLSGYSAQLDDDTSVGYVVGAAYERPDIALRVALTYFSEIDHELDTQENFAPGVTSVTDVTTPQAVNLDFQTGVAPGTLVFGQIRWADYEEVIVSPAAFGAATGGASLTDIETGFGYTLGVGRAFTDNFAGSLTLGYEEKGDDLVSPLVPTNGSYSVALGGAYTMDNGIEISGGVRYIEIGDASPRTAAGTAGASFEDNSAVAVGLKVAYSF